MALTTQEEASVRDLITSKPAIDALTAAYADGQQINDLPVAEDMEGAHVEVQAKSGASFRVNLMGALSAFNKSIAGRRWNEALSTPTGEAWGNIDMLRNLPALLGLGCYLVTDDRKRRKLDSINHYRYADGSPARLDGSEGQYMWCWNAHWYAYRVEGSYCYEIVSLTKPGYEWESYYIPAGGISPLGGGVVDRLATGGAASPRLCSLISDDTRYRGGDNTAAFDGRHDSLLGMVATAIRADHFATYARDRGDLWNANWYVSRAVTEYLFRIIMGTRNTQAPFSPDRDAYGLYQGGFGGGVGDFAQWAAHSEFRPFIKTSAGLELGDGVGRSPYLVRNSSGEVIHTAQVPVFFGYRNMYSYIYTAVNGLTVDVGAERIITYVARSMREAQSYSSVANMVRASEQPLETGWIKRLSMSKLCGMPTEVGGSSSTYYCDTYRRGAATGLCCRKTGFRSGYGTSSGMFASAVENAPTVGGINVSCPLCFFDEDPVMG